MNEDLSTPRPHDSEDTAPVDAEAALTADPDAAESTVEAGSETAAQDVTGPEAEPETAPEAESPAVTAETAGEATAEEPGFDADPTPSAPVDGEDDDAEDAEPVWTPEPDKLLLSLLFASNEYLDARGLREIMGPEWDTPRLRQLVRKLNRDLESGELPFEVFEAEGTFRLRTLPKYYPWTRKLFKEGAPRRLSQAALETLAIVAYKQPVTKAEIEAIRGVNVDGSMKTLLDKRLIDIGRRSDALGQAFTYHTTREFMRYFGINRVPDDLPRLSEFEGILNAQSLIPQMDDSGELREAVQPDEAPDAEQLTLGMDGSEPQVTDGSTPIDQ